MALHPPSFRRVRVFPRPVVLLLPILLLGSCSTRPWQQPLPGTWEETHALLVLPTPTATASPDAVDTATMDGKLFAGYQGWFIADGDGSGLGWAHYGTSEQGGRRPPYRFEPGHAVIDLWPDMTEATRSERYPTGFRHADGSVAQVFTSRHPKTIDRHFRWMKEYGVDGVFLQRFANALTQIRHTAVRNEVLRGVRTSSAIHGRTWAVMYDLSGCRAGTIEQIVQDDWKRLVDIAHIRHDSRLQRHRGKPVVAIWGIGFDDGRHYTLKECERLVRWLKEDPLYGGNAVVLGIPYQWRLQTHDAVADPAFHSILKMADVISPWAVGRLRTPAQARETTEAMVGADLEWTQLHGCDYMPVLFPGFSWYNLQRSRGGEAPLNAIPRLRGEFFRAMADGTLAGGARMLYVAMFDEIDEGTAIMKTSPNPPVGDTPFVREEGVKSDYYLRITGEIRDHLRKRVAPH